MAPGRRAQPPAADNWQTAGRSNAAETPPPATHSASVRLPDYWSDDLELWFARVDSVFRRHNVLSSINRFDYVLEKLPNEVLSSIRDIVRTSEDTADPYTLIKDRLLACNKPTVWQQVNKIIDHAELGGSRPSALMSSMLSLLPEDEKPGFLFLGHFMRRLPTELREHLAAKHFDTPQEMAAHADILWDARNSAGGVNAIGGGRGNSPRRGRRPSPSRFRPRRAQTPASDNLCFYHHTYGPRARKCTPPCSWVEQGNGEAAGDN